MISKNFINQNTTKNKTKLEIKTDKTKMVWEKELRFLIGIFFLFHLFYSSFLSKFVQSVNEKFNTKVRVAKVTK